MLLGEVLLEHLPPQPRGQARIEVTFTIDSSGMLNVRALDQNTGRQQRVTLSIRGVPSPAEVEAARQKLQNLLEDDRR
jgi:molecular chaperone DnaK